MTGHPADAASVSGRSEPRPSGDVVHAMTATPDLEFRGHATHGVIRLTCSGCPGYRRTLDRSYLIEDLVRVAAMHEGNAS